MAKTILACIAVLSLCLSSHGAVAQIVCAPSDAMLAHLSEEYGEVQRFRGLTGSTIFVITVNEASGTWSALRLTADGLACMTTSGEAGEVLSIPKPVVLGDPS